MDTILIAAILAIGIAAEMLILSRARKRAEHQEAVLDRLARYAGRYR